MSSGLTRPEPWASLRQWTGARIAMGRVGDSLPTGALLDFSRDHAQARDAVHAALDVEALAADLEREGFPTVAVRSRARSRSEYLRRPDLGRRLAPEAVPLLRTAPDGCAFVPSRLTVVVGDGLSSRAPAEHAVPVLLRLRQALPEWQLDVIVIASEARVALADEVGALRGAEMVLILLGERPGLKSPDSLGAYLTYRPRIGRMDSERNCVSNIRPEGLSYENATQKLARLIRGARALGATGVQLKEDSEPAVLLHRGATATTETEASQLAQASGGRQAEPASTSLR